MESKKLLQCANTVIGILMLVIMVVMAIAFFKMKHTDKIIGNIEYIDSTMNYNKIYYEETISELKKENRELYDSLVSKDKRIEYLIAFTAKKEYNTGTVVIQKPDTTIESRTYEYNSEPNDTLSYQLKINSQTRPNWFSLKMTTSEKFMIVNKEYEGGANHITIGNQTSNGGSAEISDVTVFKKKEKKSLKDRIIIGPSVTAGYDPINKNFGMMAGVGVTIDLW